MTFIQKKFSALFVALMFLAPAVAAVAPGTPFDHLQVGATTYNRVVVKSVNAVSLVFTHDRGLASIKLRDLSPELQTQFGYSPEAEAAAHAEAEARARRSVAPPAGLPPAPSTASKFDTLLAQFGQPPTLRPEVSLRPAFAELDLSVKNQGRRPSCAIFAVVSALEFQNAELVGSAEKLSEEYLLWSTRHLLDRIFAEEPLAEVEDAEDSETASSVDAGFSIPEVVTALRAYGIPLYEDMPNTFGTSMAAIATPPDSLVARARSRQQVFVHSVPGRDAPSIVANLIPALNAGVPVPIGLRWPHANTVRSGTLDGQQPIRNYAHAVTLVGYRCPTGNLTDTVFLFKNSYGPRWGQGGYGQVTYRYLSLHLQGAVLLEVRRPEIRTAP